MSLKMRGRNEVSAGGGGDYPLSVVLAGSQAGYDAQFGAGPRIALRPLTSADHGTAISIITPEYTIDGWTITATAITSTKVNAVLRGVDTNGRQLQVGHANPLIEDVKFKAFSTHPANPGINGLTINWTSPSSAADVEVAYCEFDGGGDKDAAAGTRAGAVVAINEHGTIAAPRTHIHHCLFYGFSGDYLQICNNGALIEHNHYRGASGIGNPSAHFDVHQTSGFLNPGGGPIIIRRNYIDMTDGPNSYGRTSGMAWFGCAEGGEFYENCIVGNNTNASGSYGDNPVYSTGVIDDPGGLGVQPRLDASEVSAGLVFRNNVIEEAVDSSFFSFFYPSEIIGFNIPACVDNYEFATAAPIDTATLLQPTNHIPSAFTFTDVTGATPGSVVTSNNVVFAGMSAGARSNCQIAVAGGSNPEYSLNNGDSWTSLASPPYGLQLSNSGQLRLRITTPAGAGAACSIAVSFQAGARSDIWNVTNA